MPLPRLQDTLTSTRGGVNRGVHPSEIRQDQIYGGRNVTLRTGPQPRPGMPLLKLYFANFTVPDNYQNGPLYPLQYRRTRKRDLKEVTGFMNLMEWLASVHRWS